MEQRRACGWRKIGGIYLVGGGPAVECDFLPYELTTCQHCGAGIKPSRGFTWFRRSFFPDVSCGRTCEGRAGTPARRAFACPLDVAPDTLFGLLWIGERFYPTPQDFMREAGEQGISRRIAQIPKNLVIGDTWIFLAHRRAVLIDPPTPRGDDTPDTIGGGSYRIAPAIFSMFRPTAIEKILTREMATDAELQTCERRGITPVVVDDRERHRTGDDDQDPLPFPDNGASAPAEGGAE